MVHETGHQWLAYMGVPEGFSTGVHYHSGQIMVSKETENGGVTPWVVGHGNKIVMEHTV